MFDKTVARLLFVNYIQQGVSEQNLRRIFFARSSGEVRTRDRIMLHLVTVSIDAICSHCIKEQESIAVGYLVPFKLACLNPPSVLTSR